MAPAVVDGALPDVVVVAERGSPAPVRFAAEADALLLIDGTDAELLERDDFTADPVDSI